MSQSEVVHHEINYVEFCVTDTAQAKQFYGSAFGWTFNDYGEEYVGIKKQKGDGEVGGFFQADNVTTGGPLVILYSNDLELSLQAVKSAGAVITNEILSFPGGRRFQFKDPFGNELAVWSDQPTKS